MHNNSKYILIDPPAVMYGPPEAIEAWLAELATYPQDSPQVQSEIRRAQDDLKFVLKHAKNRQVATLPHAPAL